MKFGSHLYGTETLESDTDFKGIYMPTKREIYLGNFKSTISSSTGKQDSKNTAQDVDDEIFSLHQFIKLACEGQTVAMDMLHAPKKMILESGLVWENLVANRHRFYTKNLNSFVGYCKKQAAKYGIKGSRIAEVQTVVDFLGELNPESKLGEFWLMLPQGEHMSFLPADTENKRSIEMYQVCGKKFQPTVKVKYVLESLTIFLTEYGHRAKLAARNEGIDWKAVSHAVRAAVQLKEIYEHNTITFPLKSAKLIKDIKQGRLDYTRIVAPMLEELIESVETLSNESTYPERVDREYWDDFLVAVSTIIK